MTHPDPLDETLRAHFARRRSHDAATAPSFEALVREGRRATDVATATTRHAAVVPPASRWRHLSWAMPLAACLALAVRLSTSSDRAADADFDALITEWTRTSASLTTTPTDALLQAPGSEYLRGTPRLPTGTVPVTPRNPS